MAAPFGLVMVLLCVALTKDLRHDPLIRRDDRSQRAVEQAVSYGVETYGDRFVINVKPAPARTEDERDGGDSPGAQLPTPRLDMNAGG